MFFRVYIAVLLIYALISAVGLAPAAQSERYPLDCEGVHRAMQLAFRYHYRYTELTPELTVRVLERFQALLLAERDALDERTLKTVDADFAAADPRAITRSLKASQCGFFEDE